MILSHRFHDGVADVNTTGQKESSGESMPVSSEECVCACVHMRALVSIVIVRKGEMSFFFAQFAFQMNDCVRKFR